MTSAKITKRTVDAAEARPSRYTIFDSQIPGFGLRVFPSGQKSWVFDYRPSPGGQGVAKKRVTIGAVEDFTADAARKEADRLRAMVLRGGDPQGDKNGDRDAKTVAEVAEVFIANHVVKATTKAYYEDLLNRLILPELGKLRAKDVRQADVLRLHRSLKDRPFLANRVLAVLGAMYGFAAGPDGLVAEGVNPTRGIKKNDEPPRDRLLAPDELMRLGAALREAETIGIHWEIDHTKKLKHLPKSGRVTVIAPAAVAAIRLLIFTGARLREILHLRWDQVDLQRGLLMLPAHKTSRKTGIKTIVLNAPSVEVLNSIERIGVYVIAGDTAGQKDEKPRSDLKRPWTLITKRSGLDGLRLHDLRHNYASFGVGGGMGLPVIGKLLGHTQPSTTARYGHLDQDPLRKAANTIGAAIAAAMGPATSENVVPIRKDKSA